jgi:uncharacterized protein YecT (DUF1311 family)
MNTAILPFILAFVLSMMSAAWAASSCDDDPTLNTLQLTECLSAKYKTTDRTLNQVYKQILNELANRTKDGETSSNAARQTLIAAQKAWLQLRDGECGARYTYFLQGTIRNSTALECKIDLTNARIETLQWWLDVLAH